MDAAQLVSLTDALRNRKVVVVGDIVADEFVYGRVARVSREAPVLILEYDSTEIVPGGAGNAANNVAALGGRATLVAVVGRDVPGRRVVAALHRRVDSRYLLRVAQAPTPVKTRILAGGIHSAKQQVVRIDRGVAQPIEPAVRQSFEKAALEAAQRGDAVLISDYGSGLITPRFVDKVPQDSACREGADSRAHRHPLRSAQVHGAHCVHAERVGSRAGARRSN